MHDRSRRRGDDGDNASSGRSGVAPGKSTRTQHIQLKSSGSGAPLPDAARGQFENSLGTDLSSVRVHTGAESAEAASGLGARAFATGQDIHFGAGQYQPDDPFGMHLLAHEVAHTVQQGSASSAPQMKLEVSSPGDSYEVEADRAADAMVRGAPTSVSSISGDAPVQRFSFDLGGGLSLGGMGGPGEHKGFGQDDDEEGDVLDEPPELNLGSQGADVVKLQKMLGVPPTGVMDEATVEAIYQIQDDHGVPRSTRVTMGVWDMVEGSSKKHGGGGGGGGWGGKKGASFGGKKSAPATTKTKKKKKGGGRGFG